MSTSIKTQLHDQLITDFSQLTHKDSTNVLFGAVKKIFISFPTTYPVCELLGNTTSVEILGNQEDTRIYGFTSIVYELIEQNASQAEAELKIDRLNRIEDRILDYLQKIPNNLTGKITDVNVALITVQPAFYDYVKAEQGITIFQTIEFTLTVPLYVAAL